MNKTGIKNFAVWARRKLISEITYKAGLIGINEKEISSPLPMSTDNVQFFDIGTSKPAEISDIEIKQRGALIKRIKEKESTSDYETAFRFVMEEVAYTWFNRLIAIRFMEANDYLPSRMRVLSSETKGKSEPDMVTTPFDTDMEFSLDEVDIIVKLKDENKLDELFRMLFIKQCNKLNEVLPELFEKTADYTEFLLNISFTDSDGIVSHLVNDIAEEDFTEAVEIIGWMYQYYNIEPKDEVFALLKKNVKITKERIPAATQLFTPDWIVRYMVENSLGRLWVEGHPNDRLKSEWKYYLEEAEQEERVKAELEKIRLEYKKLTPEDIKVIDPCMGSGHMLVYAFDVLMQIYESQGYTQREAAQIIVEKNLYGIDIDNIEYVINWEKGGFAIRNYMDSKTERIRSHNYNLEYNFREYATWSRVSSENMGMRYSPVGFIFDSASAALFLPNNILYYGLAFMCSVIAKPLLLMLNPTTKFQPGDVADLPLIVDSRYTEKITLLAGECIDISRTDWNDFETSWEFQVHPLAKWGLDIIRKHSQRTMFSCSIKGAYDSWKNFSEQRFTKLKANEEELNRIFIDIYGLQDELTPEVEGKDVTIRKADLQRDINSFLSYAVGCMFGRYSLDADGLAYAGGDWDTSKYTTFIPDKDNCIPITDEEYFKDDIVGLFVAFVKKVYGESPLEENLDFIAKALGSRGNTSREIIRNYFIKDFYKDHVKTYQKRPIYWLYDSGKQDGFKALIYMHRYTADTTGIVRIDYLHKMQKIYLSEIDRMQDMADNSNNTREVTQAEKRKEKLIKQLKETKEYDEKIAHLALSRIEIDLDDGVKVNYEKIQTGADGKIYPILGKI